MDAVTLCECFARDGLQHEPAFVSPYWEPNKFFPAAVELRSKLRSRMNHICTET